MREIVEQYHAKYNALSIREQLLVIACVLTVLVLAWFNFIFEPEYIRAQTVNTEIQTITESVDKLNGQKKQLQARHEQDPNSSLKKRITALNNQIDEANKLLDEKFHALVEPKKMARILESVLQQHSRLQLVAVRSLPSQSLIKEAPLQESKQETVNEEKPVTRKVEVFRHGLQLDLKGNYMDLLDYLKALEGMEWEFYWDAVSLQVVDYPLAEITITVHTLSLRDSWIGV